MVETTTPQPSVTLIGVGGIGTPLLPMLARLHPRHISLWDDDRVGPENLVTQVWNDNDIGKYKVDAAASRLRASGLDARSNPLRYCGEELFDTVVISAVDSMESRRTIWHGVLKSQPAVKLFIDGRLSRSHPAFAQLFVISLEDVESCKLYEEHLAIDGEPDSGRRDIDMIPAPLLLTGLIATTLVRWIRGERLPWQTVWDGTSMTLMPFF